HSNWIMAATSQNSLLLTSDEDGVVIMRNINGDRVSAPKILSEGLAVASVLTWMPMEGEPRVIAGHQDGLVTTWDVEQLQQLPSPSAQNSEIAGVTSDGERTIVVPRNSRSIHVYNALAGGSAITSMRLSNSPIRAARFSRTALLILEDTLDGPQLRWWTRESLSEVD
ncbi:MAG: WD40 repeat domain-containing protein, partial [Planctomycetota bacterium]